MIAKVPNTGVIAAVAALALGALGLNAGVKFLKLQLTKREIHPEGGVTLTTLPDETASWVKVGSDHRETAEVEDVLGTRNYVTRTYVRKVPKGSDQKPIVFNFHAAYYTGMIDTVPHVPDRCFIGSGMQLGDILGNLPLPLARDRWQVDEYVPEHLKGRIYRARASNGSYVRMPRDPDQIRLRTMKFLTPDGRTVYAGYFFIANGGTTELAEGVRLLAFDLTSVYAYYLKLQITSDQVTSGEELARETASLLGEMMPEIMRCTPDWVKVEEGTYPADNPNRPKDVASGS